MNAVQQIQQQEQNLIDVLKQAAQALRAVGASAELSAAVEDLDRAAADARQRLDAAAGKARAAFTTLAADAGSIATSLSAELGLTPAATKQQTKAEEPKQGMANLPYPVAAAAPADPVVEQVRQEIASIDRGGLLETRGTSPLPAHLLPALVAATTLPGAQEAGQADAESGAPDAHAGNGRPRGRKRRNGS